MEYVIDNVTGNVTPWNMTVDQLLMDRMGPKRNTLVSTVIFTIVYSTIFLSGLTGNICTCIVIARNHCMQTTTNYYLFSLAVSDLLLLTFGLPPELYSIWEAYPWRLGEAFCYLRQTILELTSYASVLTITAFTIERYLAICKPFLAHKIAVLSRAVKIIVVIWIISLLASLPYAVHTRIYYRVTWPPTGQPLNESLVCSIPDKWLEGRMTYIFQISTFLFFLAPVTLIICLYILIGIAVRRSPLSRGASDEQAPAQVKHAPLPTQPRRVVIRMLVAVTVAFIICWAPFHTQRLMVLYVQDWTPELLAVQSHIFYISGVLYFVSSTVNPILYNVISRRYRVAFKRTIFGPCTRFGSAGERPRCGSNTMNRNFTNFGDSNFDHCAQHPLHHALLVKDSPASTLRHARSLRYDVQGRHIEASPRDVSGQHGSQHDVTGRDGSPRRYDVTGLRDSPRRHDVTGRHGTPRRHDVREPFEHENDAPDMMTTSLCSDILNCKKTGARVEKDEDKFEDSGDLKQTEPLLCDSLRGARDCSKHLLNSGDGTCCKHSGILSPGRNSNTASETSGLTLPDQSRKMNCPDKKTILGDTSPRVLVTSHQECVDDAAGTQKNASLCKQCLTHSANGSAPYNGTVAYHVSFDTTQPRTIV